MAWFSLCSTTVFLTRPRTLGRPSSSDSVFVQSHGKGLIRVSGCSHFYVFSLTLSRRFGLELQCCHMGASISFTLHEGEIIFWKTCLHFAAKRIFSYFFLILSVTIRHHDGWQDKAWWNYNLLVFLIFLEMWIVLCQIDLWHSWLFWINLSIHFLHPLSPFRGHRVASF